MTNRGFNSPLLSGSPSLEREGAFAGRVAFVDSRKRLRENLCYEYLY
jgi:hypothetical protein